MKKQIRTISPVLNGVCVYDWKKRRTFLSRAHLVRARRVSNSDVIPNIRADKALLEGYSGNVNAVINRLNGRKKPTVGELFEQQIAKIKKSDLGQTYKTHLIKNLRQVAGENGVLHNVKPQQKVYRFLTESFNWMYTKQDVAYWSNVARKLYSKNI